MYNTKTIVEYYTTQNDMHLILVIINNALIIDKI